MPCSKGKAIDIDKFDNFYYSTLLVLQTIFDKFLTKIKLPRWLEVFQASSNRLQRKEHVFN
jgi:hypothetical protein